MEEVLVLSAVRSAIGSFLGSLKDVPAPKIAATCIREAVKRSAVKPADIDECLMGSVLPAGVGQAPARQAALFAELPKSVRCTTINRVCGSGLKTVLLGDQMIRSGDVQVVVAGGMENMSRAPFLLDRGREGYRLGHGKILDSMIHDGLWDPYGNVHMGNCAELCSKERNFTREDQDRFATQSYTRAQAAIKSGAFHDEIVGIEVVAGKETKVFATDEEPGKAKLEKFATLKPSFQKDGTVTAANASSLSDGAAALVLAAKSYCQNNQLKPIARIVGQAHHAQEPEWFTTAPVEAVRKLLKKAGKTVAEIDVFEINEAFSVVALACARELEISEAKLNPRGGAVALGHPIGASGARILTTLIHTLRSEKKRWGVAAICIGGGEASAVLVEALY